MSLTLPLRQNKHNTRPKCEGVACNNPQAKVWYDAECDTSYCEVCWPLQPQHKDGKVGSHGVPHEKADHQVVDVFRKVLQPPTSKEELRKLHLDDTDTLWFGVTKDHFGAVNFEDHGRYSTLMANSPLVPGFDNTKYPQLVSFIGSTNQGKSTVIKMLIDRHQLASSDPALTTYSSPVVGSAVNDKVPTSGDVHLYADPATSTKQMPLLYADCEGLEGGEIEPYGAQSRKRAGSGSKRFRSPRLFMKGRPRKIAWADTEDKRRREYAVSELYPRLLYTFSDVVVYVTRNPKTVQSQVLTKLLDWGEAALEKSINQPTLPHAILVLNATESGVDEKEWGVHWATEQLLQTVNTALDPVHGVPQIRDLANIWYSRGVHIATVKDLMQRYYSTFKVVRLPVKGRYGLMNEQVESLHQVIQSNCMQSYSLKRATRMTLNSDDLNIYLQAAFDHFTKHLNKPFNFIETSLRTNPLPENLGDHILQLVTLIQLQYRDKSFASGQWIFESTSEMVASCILLDCVRFRKGKAEDLFNGYRGHLERALKNFCDVYWPCSYSKKGTGTRKAQRCVNVRARHNKGHQNEKGKIIHAGDYQSSFSADDYGKQWLQSLQSHLAKVQQEYEERDSRDARTASSNQTALDLHKKHMASFFEKMGHAANYVSHTTCLCCLKEVPEHGLPCGHVLCTACVQAYGSSTDDPQVFVQSCPLHPGDVFSPRWQVHFKPEYAGIRALALDGGGIRGIIELEVLKAIEQALGGNLPVQSFFDLIVGTSTGGIIALALGVKEWSVTKCAETFTRLCNQAFTPREFAGAWGLEHMATIHHGSKYKTGPLLKALQETLGSDPLFGGRRMQTPEFAVKVAVTATSGTGKQSSILSNYSRAPNRSEEYEYVRADNPKLELGVWEAAAATSAAPGYFKEFLHSSTGRSFLDGGLYHNNPVVVTNRERKLLWPEIAERDPDLLLSIGTGMNSTTISKELKRDDNNRQAASTKSTYSRGETSSAKQPKTLPHISRVFKTLRALKQSFGSVLDSEKLWRDFFISTSTSPWPLLSPSPYIRLNPDLEEEPPSLDAKDELQRLSILTRSKLQLPALQRDVQRVAFQLVASTFYFQRIGDLSTVNEGYYCKGRIRCRFETHSRKLRKLGEFLRLQQRPGFEPQFIVREEFHDEEAKPIPITSSMILKMIDSATFEVADIDLHVLNQNGRTNIAIRLQGENGLEDAEYSLSGFPRSFSAEDSEKLARQRSPEPDAENIRPPPSGSQTPRMSAGKASSSIQTAGEHASRANGSPSERSSLRHSSRTSLSETLHSALAEQPPDVAIPKPPEARPAPIDNQSSSEDEADEPPSYASINPVRDDIQCPMCSFLGDERAVSHHVQKHFD